MSFTIQETCTISTRVQLFLFRRNNIEGIQFMSLVPITFKKYSPTNECITEPNTSHQRNKIHNIPVAQRPFNAFSLKIRIMMNTCFCNAHFPILKGLITYTNNYYKNNLSEPMTLRWSFPGSRAVLSDLVPGRWFPASPWTAVDPPLTDLGGGRPVVLGSTSLRSESWLDPLYSLCWCPWHHILL